MKVTFGKKIFVEMAKSLLKEEIWHLKYIIKQKSIKKEINHITIYTINNWSYKL